LIQATTSLSKQAFAISREEIAEGIDIAHDLYDLVKENFIPDEAKTADTKGIDLVTSG
jgi:hypothetical protein